MLELEFTPESHSFEHTCRSSASKILCFIMRLSNSHKFLEDLGIQLFEKVKTCEFIDVPMMQPFKAVHASFELG